MKQNVTGTQNETGTGPVFAEELDLSPFRPGPFRPGPFRPGPLLCAHILADGCKTRQAALFACPRQALNKTHETGTGPVS